jgi:hypothetical protein
MAVLDLLFDIAVLALPLPVIGTLQMDFQRKISVMGLFALGFMLV